MTLVKGLPTVPTGTDLAITVEYSLPYQGATTGRGASVRLYRGTYNWTANRWESAPGVELSIPYPRADQTDIALSGPAVARVTVGTGTTAHTAVYPLNPHETAAGVLDITVNPAPVGVILTSDLLAAASEVKGGRVILDAVEASREALEDGATGLNALTLQLQAAVSEADQTIDTLARTTGLGVFRATKAALDADFTSAPVGATGTDNETGDVYLKAQGAANWGVPITNTSTGSVDVVRFGARPGKTAAEVADGIDAALAFSAATGTEVVFRQDITTGRTIVVPDGARFRFTPKAKLRPSGDFTALRIPSRLIHVHAIVDTTALPTYSATAVEITGAGEQFNRLFVEYLRVDMHSDGVVNNTGSVGVALRSNTGSVSFATFVNIQVNNACTGLLLHSNTAGGFVNGNQFSLVKLNGCREFLVYRAEFGETAGNEFTALEVQPRIDGTARRGIIMYTKAATSGYTGQANGNRHAGMAWDWAYGQADGVTGEKIAIETPGGVNGTQGNAFDFPYLEYSGRVRISEFDTFTGSSYTRAPQLAGVTPGSSVQNRLATGLQDWALPGIHLDTAATVTKSGPAPTTSADNAFHVNPALRTDWANLNAPYTYTIDFGANQQAFFDAVLVAFEGYRYCRGITIEYQTAQGGAWITAFTTTNNQQNVFVWQAAGWNTRYDIYGLRVTISSPVDAGGAVRLARLDAVIHGRGGKAWAPLANPQFLGTPTVVGAGGATFPLLQGGKRIDLLTGAEVLRVGAHPTDTTLNYSFLSFAPRNGGAGAAFAGFTTNASTALRWENTLGINRYVSSGTGNGHLFDGNFVTTPAAAQSITAAGTKINLGGGVLQISSNAAYTLIATPGISDGYDGQRVTLINTGTNAITLQDQGTLAGSNLRLSAATITLGPRHNVDLLFSAAVGDWVQAGPVVAVL